MNSYFLKILNGIKQKAPITVIIIPIIKRGFKLFNTAIASGMPGISCIPSVCSTPPAKLAPIVSEAAILLSSMIWAEKNENTQGTDQNVGRFGASGAFACSIVFGFRLILLSKKEH